VKPKKARRWKEFYRLPFFDEKWMRKGKILCEHVYGITKYRIKVRVVNAEVKKEIKEGKWFSRKDLKKEFLPAPHRKMIERILS
jgi:hypothetical protein